MGTALRSALRSIFTRGRGGFSRGLLFAAGEPGAHFETYNPDALLARRNLLTYTEDFSQNWTKTNLAVNANAATAPNGTATASKLVPTNTGSASQRRMDTPVGSGVTPGADYTYSVYLKAGEYGWAVLYIGSVGVGVYVNLTTGAIGSTFIGAPISCTSEDAGNGWWRFKLVFNTGASATADARVYPALADLNASINGDGVSGIYAWGTQAEKASTASAYQKVTDWYTEYMAAALDRIGMWQDHLGTLPSTTVEQTVGTWYDIKAGTTPVPLTTVSNSFDTAVWSKTAGAGGGAWSVPGGGVASVDNTAGTTNAQLQVLSQVTNYPDGAGFFYRWRVEVAAVSGTVSLIVSGAPSISRSLSVGTNYVHGVRGDGTVLFRVQPGGTLSITSCTCEKVMGNHATQATGGSRPKLSARYNLLTKSEQFDDAAWTKAASSITANNTTAPNGSNTADLWTADGTAATHAILGSASLAAGKNTFFVCAKQNTARYLQILCDGNVAGWVNFDLTAGTFQNNGDGSVQGSITALANGFYRCQIVDTVGTSTLVRYAIVSSLAATRYESNSLALSMWLWGASAMPTNDAALAQPAYQRVNTNTDYDTAGFIHYLRFDGTDDSLQTPSVDFSGVKMMTAWVGATMFGTSGAILVELGATIASTIGSFYLSAPEVVSNFGMHLNVNGTNNCGINFGTFAVPTTQVVTQILDQTQTTLAAQVVGRFNGAATGIPTASGGPLVGAGFANAALNIGRRNNASAPFNGRLTSLTVRGSTIPASSGFIAAMEQYAARLAGQAFTSN